jgi:hypothetical protein
MAYGELLCTKCNITKPESEFHKEARNTLRNMKRTQCKVCDYIKQKKYVLKNKEKIASRTLAYRREKFRFFPQELYDERLNDQGGVCAICSTDNPGGRGQFHADHDHQTNQPRGVLCHNCNVALGNFKDNPELLQKAIKYLNKYSEVE